jgi:hypothetical protein
MADHKFKAGQTVTIVPGPVSAVRGLFKVVRALPTEHGVNQYRIKSDGDGHERVVTEDEIRPERISVANRASTVLGRTPA